MKVQVSDAPKSQKIISIELPYETFVAAEDTETELLAKDAKIQGFRPGKAPREIVKKQNAQKIRATALEKTINDAVRDALVGNSINPINPPDVYDIVIEEDKPISFTVKVDVFPVIELNKIKDFKFERVAVKITDEDVANTLSNLQQQFTEYGDIKDARPVKDGDQTEIDYEGKVDGVAFDGGTAEKHLLVIGSGQFIPGFEDGVIGMNIGDTRDVPVKFPDEYHSADLAGKEAIFTVKLHAIKEKAVPELNDEFAQKLNARFETMEFLKERIAKDLQHEIDQYTKMDAFNAMLKQFIAENPFEVPQSVINEQAQAMAKQSLQQYYQMGLNPEMFGMTPESMMGQFLDGAEEQVRRALIVNRIVEMENITVNDADLKAEVARAAEMSGMSTEDISRELVQNQQQLMGLQNDLLADKVFAYLLTVNTVDEKAMSRSDYEKMKMEEAQKAQQADEVAMAEDVADEVEAEAEEKPAKKAPAKKKATEGEAETEEKPKAKPKKKKEEE